MYDMKALQQTSAELRVTHGFTVVEGLNTGGDEGGALVTVHPHHTDRGGVHPGHGCEVVVPAEPSRAHNVPSVSTWWC